MKKALIVESINISSNQRTDLYQEVSNKIIALLENGVVPWRRPWNTYGLARNYVSGNIYKGINYILMNFTEHRIPYFLTFNQIKELGGVLNAGAKAEKVIYFAHVYKDKDGLRLSEIEAHEMIRNRMKVDISRVIKFYPVFNIEDVKGIPIETQEFELKPNEKIEKCESIVENLPNRPEIKFIDSNQAYYLPSQDYINMPILEQFQSSFAYYACLFHELIHSTGHESRLNREGIVKSNDFGSELYCTEELIAELGSSYLCSIAQINNESLLLRSASYLNDWLKVLKEDSHYIFKVASQAQKACDFIIGREVLK